MVNADLCFFLFISLILIKVVLSKDWSLLNSLLFIEVFWIVLTINTLLFLKIFELSGFMYFILIIIILSSVELVVGSFLIYKISSFY